MKGDGRSFDHPTPEATPVMAIGWVREGEAPAAAIACYGFARSTIHKWLRAAAQPGGPEGAAVPKGQRQPAPPATTPGVAGVPLDRRDYGLERGLWTRAVVASLIQQKFGFRLGRTAVGALLARLGLPPQKPLLWAYQHDPVTIEHWRRETFPAIASQAKAAGGEVYFWGESGFRADAVHGRTWGLKGQTPVIERPGQRQSISAASAVTASGGSGIAPMKAAWALNCLSV